jgi:hypothetical protein
VLVVAVVAPTERTRQSVAVGQRVFEPTLPDLHLRVAVLLDHAFDYSYSVRASTQLLIFFELT